jgi:cell division protein FtsB
MSEDQYYRKSRKKPDAVELIKKVWKNKTARLILLLFVPILSFIMFSNRGVLQRVNLENQKQEIQEKVKQVQQEQLQLQQQSKALDNDPKAIEKVAREKYGMIREGETVYKVKKEK